MSTPHLRGRTQQWTVRPDDPCVIADRIHDPDRPVSCYGDDRWDISALGLPMSIRPNPILWDRFPDTLRESFRRAAWLAINTPTPAVMLERQGTNAVEWASLGSIIQYVTHQWLWFANWLHEQDIRQLSDVTRADLERYAVRVQNETFTRSTKSGFLRSLTRLWAYATSLPSTDVLPMPPWEEEGLRDFLPIGERSAENATPIVHPSTMAPLLVWAQRVLDMADDIQAAAQQWDAMIAALPTSHSRHGHARATALVAHWADTGHTSLPPAITNPLRFDVQYLSAIHGGICPTQLGRVITASATVFTPEPDAPTPIPSPITATIDGKPWCDHINRNDLTVFSKAVLGAGLVMVGYLTGMRPQEVLALRPDCCKRERLNAATVRYTIEGRTFKRVRKNGRADPEGTQRSWTTIAPVAKAVDTLRRFSPDSTVLFPSNYDNAVPATTLRAVELIEALTETANTICERLNLPAEQWIPADPAGVVSLRRFRRTLAWHIRRLPHGPVALAIQYGHLSVSQGEGYAGLTAAGFAALLNREEVTALVDSIEQARRDLIAGAQVSGPAAKRLIELASRGAGFGGTFLTDAEIRRIKADSRLKLYDNPQTYLACMFDPDKALCQSGRARNSATEPKLDQCQPNCPNIARTDRHITGLDNEVQRLRTEADSPLTPVPLALRLHTRADTLVTLIEAHHATAITPAIPGDSDSEATA